MAPLCKGTPRLRGSVVSPYFQFTELRKVGGSRRDTNIISSTMNFFIDGYGVASGNPYVIISWWNSSNVFQNSAVVFMTIADVLANGLSATINSAITTYAAGNSLTVSSLAGIPATVPTGLASAPQAAISDCPADATTNYNVLTTLLGSLTGAVNTANTKQNAIATQLNSLLGELRTLGLIAP